MDRCRHIFIIALASIVSFISELGANFDFWGAEPPWNIPCVSGLQPHSSRVFFTMRPFAPGHLTVGDPSLCFRGPFPLNKSTRPSTYTNPEVRRAALSARNRANFDHWCCSSARGTSPHIICDTGETEQRKGTPAHAESTRTMRNHLIWSVIPVVTPTCPLPQSGWYCSRSDGDDILSPETIRKATLRPLFSQKDRRLVS